VIAAGRKAGPDRREGFVPADMAHDTEKARWLARLFPASPLPLPALDMLGTRQLMPYGASALDLAFGVATLTLARRHRRRGIA